MKTEKPDECECCQYGTNELEYYEPGPTDKIGRWLCFLCADSMAGRYFECRRVYGELAAIGGLIMNAANHIIAEIIKRDSSPDKERGK